MKPLLPFLLVPILATANPWPVWRGDLEGSGRVEDAANLPREWNRDQNVRWRVPLPERGNSTPVILGNRVFVTQAIDAEHFRGLFCFDRATGKLLWKNGLTYDKPERSHRDNPYGSASPATDGEMVVAAHGSAGLAAYDLDGKELWRRDLGPIDHEWGSASSPLLHGNLCIHYHGPGPGAFLIALDKRSGETVWKFDEPAWDTAGRTDGFRDQPVEKTITGSFSTPILIRTGADNREELVMSFPMQLMALDPSTGKVLWTCDGLNPLVYTSPVHDNGVIVSLGGYYGNSIGVRTGGSGDVTASHRLWQLVRHNGGIGSGVAKDGYLYYHNSGGVAYCLRMESGETVWEERLPGAGKSWGSFVLAGDLIYTLSQAGDTVVFKADPGSLQVVSQGNTGEHSNSSLAISDGEIFLRTYDALWCLAKSS